MSTHLFPIPGPWPGHLSVVSRPRGGDWLEDEARAWKRDGINVVVSLLEPEEAAQLDLLNESDAAETNGIRFLSLPIPDRGVPASTPAALALLSEIAGALDRGKNVAVHCRQSIGRAGLIAAGVLIASGASPEQAIDTVSAARGLPVPETPEQREWVQRLRSANRRIPSLA
jgi:protein-tyrosine phosphatase